MGSWTERWWFALGCDVHVQVETDDPTLAEAASVEVEYLEQALSRFRPTSDLSRLNADPRPEVPISRPLAEALHRCVIAWTATNGWFDPTIIDSLEAVGYDRPFPLSGEFEPHGFLAHAEPGVGMADVSVDLDNCVVRRPVGLRFDLGGIGKGLTADLITMWLLENGAERVCLGLGGDIRVGGEPPEGGWRIPVEYPRTSSFGEVPPEWFDAVLATGAIVASTTRYRRWVTAEGFAAHHLIDPRTGLPAHTGVHTAIVASSEAWWAEVLAKAALIAGSAAGHSLLERHGATGWLLSDQGAQRGAA